MKFRTLTSSEARDVMPYECQSVVEDSGLVLGAIQMDIPAEDQWPSGWELDQEAKARFGAAKLADCEAYECDESSTVTWLVVRA